MISGHRQARQDTKLITTCYEWLSSCIFAGADGARMGGSETICDCGREELWFMDFVFLFFLVFEKATQDGDYVCV